MVSGSWIRRAGAMFCSGPIVSPPDMTSSVNEVVSEIVAIYGRDVWIRNDSAAMETDVDLDANLRSVDRVGLPDVRIVQSNTDHNVQLVIGTSNLDLWWRGPDDARMRVEELRAVLHAVSKGRYREKVVADRDLRVVHGELHWDRDAALRMKTIYPRG